METRTYSEGDVIVREGDPGGSMFTVDIGRVGIYSDYGKANQLLLAEICPDHYFGEMGLFENTARSATAVALDKETAVSVITEKNFCEFFRTNPARVLAIMQQMSHNLRRRTDDFVSVCRSVKELMEKEGTK